MSKHIPKNILFLSVTSRLGGGEMMLLNILDNLNREKFNPIVVLPSDGPLRQELIKRNIKCGIVLNTQSYSKVWPFPFLAQVLKFIYWIVKEDIDLMHANGVEVCRAAGIAAFITGCKSICHLHSETSKKDLKYSFIVPPHTVIACCEDIARAIRTFLPPVPRRTSVRTLVNSIDVSRFKVVLDSEIRAVKILFNLDPKEFVVTTVGDLSEGKGVKYFLLSFLPVKLLKFLKSLKAKS